MVIYYIYFILLIFFSYIYIFEYKLKYNLYGVALLFVFSVYLASLRDINIPYTDFFVYKQNYYGLNDNTMSIGYSYLQHFFRYMGLDFNIFLFFFISISLLIKLIAFKNISNYWILIFYFYLLGLFLAKEMATLRMALAFGIFIYSIKFVIEKNFFKYFITNLIAFLFHKSAIFLIPFYFLGYIRLNFIKTILLLIMALVIDNNKIIENIVNSIINNNFFAGSYIWIKLQTFSNYNDGTTVGLILTVIIKKILILLIGLYTKEKYKNVADKKINIFFNYMFIGIFLLFLLGNSIIWAAAMRFSVYFSIFELIILVYFIFSFKNKINRLLVFLLSILYVGSKFIVQIIKYYNLYIPYHSILNSWM
jgi:transmembrane protein EpsG